MSVSFSPIGEYVVTGNNDGTARIWAVETGELVHELTGHHDDVTSVSFSPTGEYVVTGSDDGTARSGPLVLTR